MYFNVITSAFAGVVSFNTKAHLAFYFFQSNSFEKKGNMDSIEREDEGQDE